VTLKRPSHLYHLATSIDAGQKPALSQPVMQCLLAQGQTLGPRRGLGNVIAGPRL
jgi:hypothetical protein